MLNNIRDEKDLPELSSLGHFLKGSSATLGLIKVKDGCEKIQHFGASMDETGTLAQPDEETSLRAIKKTLDEVVVAYRQVEKLLRRYYGEEVKDEEEKPPVKEEKKTEEKPEAKEEPKKATEAKDTKDVQEPKEAKEPKDSKDSKEPEAKKESPK
jgi:osomolarity two-component system phosphorelay intermediate protein YPD1